MRPDSFAILTQTRIQRRINRPVFSTKFFHVNPSVNCVPTSTQAKAISVSPTPLNASIPSRKRESPTAPPAPAGSSGGEPACSLNNKHAEATRAKKPRNRMPTTVHDQDNPRAIKSRPPAMTRPATNRYATQPKANSANSAIHAPLIPTRLLTRRSVPA